MTIIHMGYFEYVDLFISSLKVVGFINVTNKQIHQEFLSCLIHLGAIQILRKHILDQFLTHPPTM